LPAAVIALEIEAANVDFPQDRGTIKTVSKELSVCLNIKILCNYFYLTFAIDLTIFESILKILTVNPN